MPLKKQPMNETELKQFLATLQRQLNILNERKAKAGDNAPLELLNQIDDHKQAIALTAAALAGEITAEALEEQLKPLGLSLSRGGTEIVSGDKVAGDKFEVEKSFVKVVIEGTSPKLLLGVLAVVILATYLAWLRFVPDKMPSHTFNVAVAEFGQVDAQGRVSSSEDGQNLSEWMFGELQAEYKTWPAGQPTAWHDSLSFFKKRAKIGLITGSTPAERNAAAQAVAERVGANMVIYGNITVDGNPVDFMPEFYVAAIRNEADEIVGQHQLGSPIPVQLPINFYDDRTSTFFEEKLGVRVDALVWFTRGLALDLSGRHEDALSTFKTAEAELENWADNQGKDILHYFIGREALFLGRNEPERLDEAEAAFKEALALNAGYARGHIGLGGVYFQKAQQSPPEQRLETDYLDLAIAQYTTAVEEALRLAETEVEIKGRLGLGIAYRLQGDAYLRAAAYDQADPAYDLAIEEIESALALLSRDQHRLSAQAYLGLGAAYEGRAYITRYIQQNEPASKPFYENAQAAYEHCIAHADEEFYDSLLQELKTDYCGPYSQEVQNVLDGL